MDYIVWWESWASKALMFDKWTHAGGSCLICCFLFGITKIFLLLRGLRAYNKGEYSRVFSARRHFDDANVAVLQIAAVVWLGGVLLEIGERAMMIHHISVPDIIANSIGIALFIWTARNP